MGFMDMIGNLIKKTLIIMGQKESLLTGVFRYLFICYLKDKISEMMQTLFCFADLDKENNCELLEVCRNSFL